MRRRPPTASTTASTTASATASVLALVLGAVATLTGCGGHAHHAAKLAGTAVKASYAYQVLRTTGATGGTTTATATAATAAATLTVGFATSLQVSEAVFVLPDTVPASCVVSADLVLPITSSGGLESAQVAAYPSALFAAADGAKTLPGGANDLLATTPAAAGTLTGTTTGTTTGAMTYTFDLTALYARWQQGGTFPGARTAVPKGTPLIVVVRATSYANESFVFTTSAAAVHEQLVTTPGCTG